MHNVGQRCASVHNVGPSVHAPPGTREGRGVSGQYGGRDAACPVSTGGGTLRVRLVRGKGRCVSGLYGGGGGRGSRGTWSRPTTSGAPRAPLATSSGRRGCPTRHATPARNPKRACHWTRNPKRAYHWTRAEWGRESPWGRGVGEHRPCLLQRARAARRQAAGAGTARKRVSWATATAKTARARAGAETFGRAATFAGQSAAPAPTGPPGTSAEPRHPPRPPPRPAPSQHRWLVPPPSKSQRCRPQPCPRAPARAAIAARPRPLPPVLTGHASSLLPY